MSAGPVIIILSLLAAGLVILIGHVMDRRR